MSSRRRESSRRSSGTYAFWFWDVVEEENREMGGAIVGVARIATTVMFWPRTLLHADLVEYLYYWCHRALHHHYLYSRYHSHHHSSIVTEPITSVIHPFAEHIVYSLLFSIPMLATVFMGTVSVISFAGYITYIDFMNNMGHCNFELIPNCLFSLFPPLKYLMYTPSFHSLHHTQFQINYSLFMPFYDYIYGTMDKSTDSLYETSLKREVESPDVLHLTHLTTPESIYHLPLGFASLSSMPDTSKWYLWLMWPVTFWYMVLIRICGRTFVIERQRFNKLRLQTWVIPIYTLQYYLRFQKGAINSLIEEAIVQAERKGVKFISLGLLNQGEELNRYGGLYVDRHPHLKIKVVDGSSLAVAVILNSIPKRTTQVVLRGNLTKVAYAIAYALSQKGIQVATLHQDEYIKLTKSLSAIESSLVAESHAHKNPFPSNFKMPAFPTFTGEDNSVFSRDHIFKFSNYCVAYEDNPNYKLRLFGNSLAELASQWYSLLPPNSIANWGQMEMAFHEQFYIIEQEMTINDLVEVKQYEHKSTEDFMMRFRKTRMRCQFPVNQAQLISIAQRALKLPLRKRFYDTKINELHELVIAATRYEKLLLEE
nr:very-long-chain aldehyde decarbonylase CER1-like [Malus domestica]